MVVKHLSQHELSLRWALSPRTLERWRWTGEGPRYLKLNGRIAYRLVDVEVFEGERVHDSTRKRVDDPHSLRDK